MSLKALASHLESESTEVEVSRSQWKASRFLSLLPHCCFRRQQVRMTKSSSPLTTLSFSKVGHIQRGGIVHTLTYLPCLVSLFHMPTKLRLNSPVPHWQQMHKPGIRKHWKDPSKSPGKSFLRSLFFTNHCYYYIKLLLMILKLLVLYYCITELLKILKHSQMWTWQCCSIQNVKTIFNGNVLIWFYM